MPLIFFFQIISRKCTRKFPPLQCVRLCSAKFLHLVAQRCVSQVTAHESANQYYLLLFLRLAFIFRLLFPWTRHEQSQDQNPTATNSLVGKLLASDFGHRRHELGKTVFELSGLLSCSGKPSRWLIHSQTFWRHRMTIPGINASSCTAQKTRNLY